MATFKNGGLVQRVSSTQTSGGTTNLGIDSAQIQVFTGNQTQTVVLPDHSVTTIGQRFEFYNQSSGTITVTNFGATVVTSVSIPGNNYAIFYLINNTSSGWSYHGSMIEKSYVDTTPLTTSNPQHTYLLGNLQQQLDSLDTNVKSKLSVYDNGNSGSIATIDWSRGKNQKLVITDDCVINFTNATAGRYLLRVKQGISGKKFQFPTYVKFPSYNGDPESWNANGITYPIPVGRSMLLEIFYTGSYYSLRVAYSGNELISYPGLGAGAYADPLTSNLWIWGSGGSGRIGNNSISAVSSPITISSVLFDQVFTDFGSSITYAIDRRGMVWAWGAGSSGRLGDLSTTSKSSPVTIARSASYSKLDYAAGPAGAINAATGMIWVWGSGSSGWLGNNTVGSFSSPVTIARSSSYVDIAFGSSAGGNGAAIEGSTGRIWVWGWGSGGILGNNTVTSVSSPVTIARAASYSKLSFSTNAFGAIEASTGMIWTWGSGNAMGNNTTTSTSSPVTIARSSSYSDLAAAQSAMAAIDASTGAIWTWGTNTTGQLGDNTLTSRSSPVSLAINRSFLQVRASKNSGNFFALDSTGNIWVWGSRTVPLGDGLGTFSSPSFNNSSSPVTIARSSSYSIVSGTNSSVVLIDGSTGSIWVAGQGTTGRLGNNTLTNTSSPVTIARSSSYSQIAGSLDSVGAIGASTGMVWMWGTGSQLGNNTTTTVSSPVTIARSSSYSRLGISSNSAGAIDASTGMIWVWGGGVALGNNTTTPVSSPVTIARSSSYSAIDGGWSSAGAIDASTGMIWMWGTGSQLGNNTTTTVSSPVTIARSSSYSFLGLNKWNEFSSAIDASTGMIWMWGWGTSGQLGNNTTTTVSSPVTIARSSSYSFVSCGSNRGLAIDASTGMIWAWGVGTAGQLGNNTLTNTSSPVTIARSSSYSMVFAPPNGEFTHAIEASTGIVWAWGALGSGISYSLGTNEFNPGLGHASSPVSVARLFNTPNPDS